jgi:outer membrane protein OmpA-like peptidoglycan-associated protein
VVIARATLPPVEPTKPPVEPAKPPVEPTKPPIEPQNATQKARLLVRATKKKLVKEKEGRIELVKPLTFFEGRTVPLPGSTPFLQELVDILVRDPSRRLRIEGHTDNKEGDEQSRKQISESRARALAELLVQTGLDPARIEAVGLGDTQPKAPNLTPRGRDLNRRVEFLLLQP